MPKYKPVPKEIRDDILRRLKVTLQKVSLSISGNGSFTFSKISLILLNPVPTLSALSILANISAISSFLLIETVPILFLLKTKGNPPGFDITTESSLDLLEN